MNLILDGNYWFYKTLHVVKPMAGSRERFLDKEEHEVAFIKKVATDIAHSIRFFGKPKRIIFTIDGKSWRNDIQIEENEGYKSERDKKDDVNWDRFYELMNEFADIQKENNGWIISKVDRAEGDDLMYLWAKRLLIEKSENSVVVTGDHDMHQIVRINNDNYIVVFNPNSQSRKIYGSTGLSKLIERLKNKTEEKNVVKDFDIFDPTIYIKKKEDPILNALKKVKYKEIDKRTFLLNKVITGDGGDSVPGLYQWKTTTETGKTINHRITEKRAEKILNYVFKQNPGIDKDNFNIYQLPEYYLDITSGIENITKAKNLDPDKIKDKIVRNIKLMVLNRTEIPEYIMKQFLKNFKENIKLPVLKGKKYKKDSLIENTRFLKEDDGSEGRSFQAGLFGDLDKL